MGRMPRRAGALFLVSLTLVTAVVRAAGAQEAPELSELVGAAGAAARPLRSGAGPRAARLASFRSTACKFVRSAACSPLPRRPASVTRPAARQPRGACRAAGEAGRAPRASGQRVRNVERHGDEHGKHNFLGHGELDVQRNFSLSERIADGLALDRGHVACFVAITFSKGHSVRDRVAIIDAAGFAVIVASALRRSLLYLQAPRHTPTL
jgi:hypothetical protein